MSRSTPSMTRLIDFPELRILRPENKKLFCNLRHLSWSLSSLAILAACSGGGGGGGGGTASTTNPTGGVVQNPDPTPGGQRSAATLEGLKAEVEKSPADSGIIINLGSEPTWGKYSLESGKAYAYADNGARLLNTEGQSHDADTPSIDKKASISGNNFDGTSGDDYFYGNNVANEFDGGGGDDVINGGSGEDTLNGGGDNDTLNGDGDRDFLIGGDGDDTLNGGAGHDIIWGGSGADTMTGGEGDDVFVIIGADGKQFNYGMEKLMVDIQATLPSWTHGEVDLADTLGLDLSDIKSALGDNEYEMGETIDGGGGINILIIFGEVDVSTLAVNPFTNINQIQINSKLTLSAEQLNNLGDVEIVGKDGESELEIKYSNTDADSDSDSDTEVDFTGEKKLGGLLKVSVDKGVTLKLKEQHLEDVKNDDLKLQGEGEVDFDADIAEDELMNTAEETLGKELTLKERGEYADGDERGGSAGKLAVRPATPQETKVGDTITAGFDDEDFDILREIITYQWLRDGEVIEDAETANYVLQDADVGTKITAQISYDDIYGNHAIVANLAGSVRADTPGFVSFETSEGTKVGAKVNAELSDTDNARDILYQWLRDGEVIDNANGASYILQNADVGKDITVRVTYTDDFGDDKIVKTTDTIGTVINDISGTVTITKARKSDPVTGDILIAKLEDSDSNPTAVEYAWLVEGVYIPGETKNYYRIQAEDIGKAITLEVTYRDEFNRKKVAYSDDVIPLNTIGRLTIAAPPGAEAGDVLYVRFEDPDEAVFGENSSLIWLRDGVEISGAIYSLPADAGEILARHADAAGDLEFGYVLTEEDYGSVISARIIYADAAGGRTLDSANSVEPNPDFVNIIHSNDEKAGEAIYAGDLLTFEVTDEAFLDVISSRWYLNDRYAHHRLHELLTKGDAGEEIIVEVTYTRLADDGSVETVTASDNVIPENAPGELTISAPQGLGIDATLTLSLNDRDGVRDAVYKWFRSGEGSDRTAIDGVNGKEYVLQAQDADKIITASASYTDDFKDYFHTTKFGYGEPQRQNIEASTGPITPESIKDTMSEDMKVFALLDNFVGVNLSEEARIIYVNQYNRFNPGIEDYEQKTLPDAQVDKIDFRRSGREGTVAQIKANLTDIGADPNEKIIFSYTGDDAFNLDDLFDAFPNSIFLQTHWQDADGRGEHYYARRFSDAGYDKWAAKGKLYFASYAENNSAESIYKFPSLAASEFADNYFTDSGTLEWERTKHNYFTPANAGSVLVTPKIQAAYNALHKAYGVDFVETMLLLRSTAEHFENPQGGYGLGEIDLRKLLVSDEYGNVIVNSNGSVSLKSLEDLRTQANTEGSVDIQAPENAQAGDTLTAKFRDPDAASDVIYQWLDSGEPIVGEDAPTYVLQDGQSAQYIAVRVTYNDKFGSGKSVISTASADSGSASSSLVEITRGEGTEGTVSVTFSGAEDSLRVGDILTATLSDADHPEHIRYKWFKPGEFGGFLQASSENTYTIKEGDGGNKIMVQAEYSDDHSVYNRVYSEVTLNITDSPGTLTIDAPDNAQVGDSITAVIDDPDGVNASNGESLIFSQGRIAWYRNGNPIVDALRYVPMNPEEDSPLDRYFRDNPHGSFGEDRYNLEYVLREQDIGATITAKVVYDGGPRELQELSSDNSFTFEHSGVLSIYQAGSNVGDVLLAQFTTSVDNPQNITYQWFRDGQQVDGINGNTYTLTAEDAEAAREGNIQITAQVTYDGLGGDINSSNTIILDNISEEGYEEVGYAASADMQAFAGLGNFSGGDPLTMAQPIQIINGYFQSDRIGKEQLERLNAKYEALSLEDTGADHVNIAPALRETFHSASSRQDGGDFTFGSYGLDVLKGLHLPNDNIIVMNSAVWTDGIDLDDLFEAFPNAIVIEHAGGTFGNRRSTPETQAQKYAEQGKFYLAGYYGENNEGYYSRTGSTPATEANKDYYFGVNVGEDGVSPLQRDAARDPHYYISAKLEAAYNALNHFYADKHGHISLVETMRILKSTADNFNNPSDSKGLGDIDLRALLITDADGNPAAINGNFALKPLTILRAQAGLDPATGDPSTGDITETVNTEGTLEVSASTAEIKVGTTLTAVFTDPDALSIPEYQWLKGGVAIAGATSESYILRAGDADDDISVQVTYREFGNQVSITSDVSRFGNTPATLNIDTTQGRRVGETLSVDFADPDNTGAVSYHFYRDNEEIFSTNVSAGSESANYTLVNEDIGADIRVEVRYEDDGNPATIVSDSITIDTPGAVSIESSETSVRVGDILIASLNDSDSLQIIGYQWYREGVAISDADEATYTLRPGDAGDAITVRITYNEFNRQVDVTSDAVVPENTPGTLSIDSSGGTNIGSVLRADFYDPDDAGSVRYQWLNGDNNIIGTGDTYILQSSDVGKTIKVKAFYLDDFASAYITSAPIAIGGDTEGTISVSSSTEVPQVGTTLTAHFEDTDIQGSASYQWFKSGNAIEGATSASYRLRAGDADDDITVKVTYNQFDAQVMLESDAIIPKNTPGFVTIKGWDGELVGSLLFASVNDPDKDRGVQLEWFRDGVLIESFSDARGYRLKEADAGEDIMVKATYTEDSEEISIFSNIITVAREGTSDVVSINEYGKPLATGTELTATLTERDIQSVGRYYWLRDGIFIANSDKAFYELRPEDVGHEISVKILYRDSVGKVVSESASVVSQDTEGKPVISAPVGMEAGDSLTVTLNDPDNPKNVSYQWFIGDSESNLSPISGADSENYILTASDVNQWVSVRVTYHNATDEDEDALTTLTSSFKPADSYELVPDAASADLKAFARLGHFTGDNPTEEVHFINIEWRGVDSSYTRTDEVNQYLRQAALHDSSAQTITLDSGRNTDDYTTQIKAKLDELNLSHDDKIIFTVRNSSYFNLDDLLTTYGNSVLLQSGVGSRLVEQFDYLPTSERAVYEKWAQEGRLYLTSYAEDNDTSLISDLAALKLPIYPDYFFTDSHKVAFGETPNQYVHYNKLFAALQIGGKIEAAYNALQQTYGNIDLLETLQILRGTAEHFDNPYAGFGLGAIDLRKLLVSDSQGNPKLDANGHVTLKPLEELRAAANTEGSVTLKTFADAGEGDVITAHFRDPDLATDIGYQWSYDGNHVSETGDSYVLKAGETADKVALRVTYDDAFGDDVTVESDSLAYHYTAREDTKGSIAIETPGGISVEELQPGDTIRAVFSDPDNPTNIRFRWFNWGDNGRNLQFGSEDTYTLKESDFGNDRFSVRVHYSDDHGHYKGGYSLGTAILSLPDAPGTLTIAAPDDATVGSILTANISDPDGVNFDLHSIFSSGSIIAWYRNGEIVRDSIRRIPPSEDAPEEVRDIVDASFPWYNDNVESSLEYVLQTGDIGATITARAIYDGGPVELQDIRSENSFIFESPGHLSIYQAGSNVGDVLLAQFVHPDVNPEDITYTWFRNGEAVQGISGDTYRLTEADVDAPGEDDVEVTVEAIYNGLSESISSSNIIALDNISAENFERVSYFATEDLHVFAKLGNFTGSDPLTEAQPIQKGSYFASGFAKEVQYGMVSLHDTARYTINMDVIPYYDDLAQSIYLEGRRLDNSVLNEADLAIELIKNLNAPSDNIIFLADSRRLDLDKLFDAYPNAILLESVESRISKYQYGNPYTRISGRAERQELIEKYAEQGKYYFTGYRDLPYNDRKFSTIPAGEETKDYYITANPDGLNKFSHSHLLAHHTIAAQIEAAYNALNYFHGEENGHISLVETVRILKGTAGNFRDPSAVDGLGHIDLRKLLVTDAEGNPTEDANGNVTLKSLAVLRADARLNPNTGLPSEDNITTTDTAGAVDIASSGDRIAYGTILTANLNDPDVSSVIKYEWFKNDQLVGVGETYSVQAGDAHDEITAKVTYREFGTETFVISESVIPENTPGATLLYKEPSVLDLRQIYTDWYQERGRILQDGVKVDESYGVMFFDPDITGGITVNKYVNGVRMSEEIYTGTFQSYGRDGIEVLPNEAGAVLQYWFTYEDDVPVGAEPSMITVKSRAVTVDTPGSASISGTTAAAVGNSLTANLHDPDRQEITGYEWYKNGVPITGANDETYVLRSGDAGSEITVEITYNEFDHSQTVTSDFVIPVNTAGIVSINAQQGTNIGDTLTANLNDPDTADNSASFQWLRGDAEIDGATQATYILQAEDRGAEISVRADYSDNIGSYQISSDAIATDYADTPNAVSIILANTEVKVNDILTANLNDDDSRAITGYQWLKGGVTIPGANNQIYVLHPGDVGYEITVRISYTEFGQATYSISDPVTPTNTPYDLMFNAQDGAQVGETLMVDFYDPDSTGNITYHWERNGIEIFGANGTSYTLQAADAGKDIKVKIKYTDGDTPTEIFSNSVKIGQAPPQARGAPAPQSPFGFGFSQDDDSASQDDGGPASGSPAADSPTGDIPLQDYQPSNPYDDFI